MPMTITTTTGELTIHDNTHTRNQHTDGTGLSETVWGFLSPQGWLDECMSGPQLSCRDMITYCRQGTATTLLLVVASSS